MKSCIAPARTTLAMAAGRRSSFSMMATCRFTSATADRGQPERRPSQQGRPAAGRRQARTHAALDRQHRHAPGVEIGGAAAAEHEQLGRARTSAARDPPRARASSAPRAAATLPSTARRRRASKAASRRRRGRRRAESAPSRRWPRATGVGNRVAIGVAQVERVQERDAQREACRARWRSASAPRARARS